MVNLSVVNDSAERAVSLVDNFIKKIRLDGTIEREKHLQELLQVVEHYRKMTPDFSKKTLAKL